MYYMEGASPEAWRHLKRNVTLLVESARSRNGKRTKVSIEPLPSDTGMFLSIIRNGEKVERSLEPIGMIKITYPNGYSMSPYGMKHGKPWLVGVKVTKLNWKGPPEDSYQVSVRNSGDHAGNFTVACRYMASGEEVKWTRNVALKAKAMNGFSVFANELISVRISTKRPGIEFEGTIKRVDEKGEQIELVKEAKQLSSEAPFVFERASAK
jgi:hypothetical protein